MPLSFEFDLDSLLAPISEDSPAGINLLLSDDGRATRSALRDLREEARRIERRADEGDDSEGGWSSSRSIWKELRDQGLEVLRTQSKDLDIAALTVEALVRTDGFAGLEFGITVLGILVEGFWDDLYPAPDPEDGPADESIIIEERSLPLQRLAGLDSEGLLVPPILHVPMLVGRSDESYGLCHWRSSRELIGEENEEKIQLAVERGAVSPKQFDQAVSETNNDFIKEVYLDIQKSLKVWEELSAVVGEKSAGVAVMPAGEIRGLLEECGDAIKVFAPSAIPQERDESDEDTGAVDSESSSAEAGGGGIHPVSREDAFQRLEKIADYFENHDPHSLVGAQIRNVIRLGRLSRSEYYKQLLRDEAAREMLFLAVGMENQLSSEDE